MRKDQRRLLRRLEQHGEPRLDVVRDESGLAATLNELLALEAHQADHPSLLNVYSVLRPRSGTRPIVAERLLRWLISDDGRAAIARFRFRSGAVPLFTPWSSEVELRDSAEDPEDAADGALEDAAPPSTDSVRGSTARGATAHNLG